MTKKAKPVDASKLPPMSATLLAFAQGKATIAAMAQARLTTYIAAPRLAFADVVTEPSDKAEVRATAFLLDRPPCVRGQA